MRLLIKKTGIIFLCLALIIFFDLSSKLFVKSHMERNRPVSLVKGFVRLIYIENPGGMLGFGEDQSDTVKFWVLIAGVSIVIAFLIIYLLVKKRSNRIQEAGLLMIAAGGAGNLIDRVFNNGRVIDFILIGFKSFHTAVFNFADLFIFIGSVLFILSRVTTKKATTNEIDSNRGIQNDPISIQKKERDM